MKHMLDDQNLTTRVDDHADHACRDPHLEQPEQSQRSVAQPGHPAQPACHTLSEVQRHERQQFSPSPIWVRMCHLARWRVGLYRYDEDLTTAVWPATRQRFRHSNEKIASRPSMSTSGSSVGLSISTSHTSAFSEPCACTTRTK